jgi:hypothetical protein
MAKRKRQRRASATIGARVPETIGAALGRVAAKLDGWMAERREIASQLNAVITRARSMLSSLEVPLPKRRRGRLAASSQPRTPMRDMSMLTAGQPSSGRKRKRRKMSAAARKKISDAQKARWARQKKTEK